MSGRRNRHRSAAHELAEAALLASLRLFLVEEREPLLLELVEELVPRDRLELVFPAVPRVVDAKQAGVILAAGAFDSRRAAAALLDPFSDEVMIGGLVCLSHLVIPFWRPSALATAAMRAANR